LTEISKTALKPYLLEDLKIEGFTPGQDTSGKQVVVTRANFGCGSSREHAPWALEVNGIHLVIAESFARIFRQNMFNCGMMAVELAPSVIDDIFKTFAGKKTAVQTDLRRNIFTFQAEGAEQEVAFKISDFERSLVEAGGWLEYADSKY
jgi:3-isopropylmalate/(R)-2-methylmalate dehydratase small subunit